MAKSKMIGVQMPLDQRERFKATAKARGMTLSEAAREAIHWWNDFSEYFRQRVHAIGDQFDVQPAVVIENFVLDKVARDEAENEVSPQPFRLVLEFSQTSDGNIMSGEHYFAWRKEDHVEQFRKQTRSAWSRNDAGEPRTTPQHSRS